MVTAGADARMNIFDIRTYKEVHSYFTPTPATSLHISDTGLLGVGWGPHVTVWKDVLKTKQNSPYLTHLQEGNTINRVRFCPYDDVLGVGHAGGFSSLIVPGSGEPNFDALEANPYETKKQRQEYEVKALLNKLRPEMINLDPDFVGRIDVASVDVKKREHQEMRKESAVRSSLFAYTVATTDIHTARRKTQCRTKTQTTREELCPPPVPTKERREERHRREASEAGSYEERAGEEKSRITCHKGGGARTSAGEIFKT